MKAYQTDTNGFFIGEVTCQPSPLEPGQFLIPAGAFTDEPPQFVENQIPKRIDGSWEIIPNYSGKVYYNKITKVPKIFEIGEEFDNNYTDLEPKDKFVKFENDNWVVDDEAIELDNKNKRIAELKKLLSDSDFRMTNDYFADMSLEDQIIWTTQRNDWRTELRGLI